MAQTISAKYTSQLHNLMRWNRGYSWNTTDNVYAYDETTLIEFKIITNLQNDASIFGNTICKYAEVKVQNPNNNTYTPTVNESINLYAGLTLDIDQPTQEVEYLNQGTFTILNIKEDRDNESFTLECYDSMIKFNVPYIETGVYPMTLGNFAAHLCAKVGLELGNTTFPNSTVSIQRPNVADNEYNVRTLLGWVAELAGGNAIIGRDNKVYIRNYGAASVFTITPDIYYKLKKSPQFGPLNSVAMIREALGDTVAYPDPLPLNPVSFKLIDNMVAYDQRESIIQTIYNTVNGLTYVPFSLEWRATGHLDFMDKITITNTEGENIVSYVMNQTLTFNGALSEELSAVAYTAAAAAVKNAGTSNNKLKYTEAKVNKVDGEITLIAQEVDDLGTDVSKLLIDVNGINATVSNHTGAIAALEIQADSIITSVSEVDNRITPVITNLTNYVLDSKTKGGNVSIFGLTDFAVVSAEAKSLGLNTLTFPIRIEATDATDSNPTLNITDWNKVKSFIQEAKLSNYKVILEPYPYINNGTIVETNWNPSNKSQWFTVYTSHLLTIATFAEQFNVDGMYIASNLVHLEPLSSSWATLISSVRSVFSGNIIYRTNWWVTASWAPETVAAYQAKLNNPIFGLVDIIAIAAYFELTDTLRPTKTELKNAIFSVPLYGRGQNIHNEVKSFYDKWGKPIMFGELGIPAWEGAAAQPWNYYQGSSAIWETMQSNWLDAFYEVFWNYSWFYGYSIFTIGQSDSVYKIRESGRLSVLNHSTGSLTGDVNSLLSRVTTAEIKLTPSVITSTVRSSTEYLNDLGTKYSQTAGTTLEQTVGGLSLTIDDYVDGKLSGTKYTFDGTGATFTNGGLTIKNNSGVNVLSSDVNGNLTLKGTLDAVGGTFTGALSAATGTFSGQLAAATGSFSGAITTSNISASGGSIAGWSIVGNTLKKGEMILDASGTNGRITFNTGSSLYGLPASNIIRSTGDFSLEQDKKLYLLNASGTTTLSADNFSTPLTMKINNNPILTTASAATASVRGGLRVEYDSATATLNIYN